MSELGRRLKEEREKKQLSLEDLQKETKIQKRYLNAIEEGNFDILPGKFYARAFVKNYAEVVGLDPEQLFDELGHELPSPTKEVSDIPSRSERPKQPAERKTKGKSSFVTVLIGFVGVLVVIIGIYVVAQSLTGEETAGITPDEQEEPFDGDFSDEIPIDDPKVPVDEEEPIAIEDEQEEEVEEESTHQLEFIETVGNNSFFELSGTDKFQVNIEYVGASYVDIRNGKGHYFEPGSTKASGDTQEFDFSEEEEILFNFGASAGVKLLINNEELEFPLDVHVQRITVKFLGNE